MCLFMYGDNGLEKTYYLVGFEPWPFVSETDMLSTEPKRVINYGNYLTVLSSCPALWFLHGHCRSASDPVSVDGHRHRVPDSLDLARNTQGFLVSQNGPSVLPVTVNSLTIQF